LLLNTPSPFLRFIVADDIAAADTPPAFSPMPLTPLLPDDDKRHAASSAQSAAASHHAMSARYYAMAFATDSVFVIAIFFCQLGDADADAAPAGALMLLSSATDGH
jgi:hypothetical protein